MKSRADGLYRERKLPIKRQRVRWSHYETTKSRAICIDRANQQIPGYGWYLTQKPRTYRLMPI